MGADLVKMQALAEFPLRHISRSFVEQFFFHHFSAGCPRIELS